MASRSIVGGWTLFLFVAAAVNGSVAAVYSRGVTRLHTDMPLGERDVRILARPLQLTAGMRISMPSLASHLQEIGYYPACTDRGCFTTDDHSITIRSRYPENPDVSIGWRRDTIAWIATPEGDKVREARIEPETLLTLMPDASGAMSRTSNDPLPERAWKNTALADAIVASEDRLFPTHHGVDVARLALVPFVGGGASTVTMQVARVSVLQDRSRTVPRKLNEIGTAMALERMYPKDAIMDAYVNNVDLGARRGRPLHGFGAAAREFFGVSDVRLVTPLQAATLVALLNQPSRYLDAMQGGDDSRLRHQRNRVLRLMNRLFPDRYPDAMVAALEKQEIQFETIPPAEDLQKISRQFVDAAVAAAPRLPQGRVYTTVDPVLQRIGTEVVEEGLATLQQRVPRLRTPQLQAALVAIAPGTGDVLAMIGGRPSGNSQFNHALNASRQVGSVMKPFDYLAALERARAEGRTDLGPDATVLDVPTVFVFPGRKPWSPANYNGEYGGTVTWRDALAHSRNVAAVKVASWAGIDRVARLWEAASGQHLHDAPPAMALGAIEATPTEVARAYALFATGGMVPRLRTFSTAVSGARTVASAEPDVRRVASADTTAQVADMLRSVLEVGTGRGARDAGLTVDAAGKTGTTNELRDAWFAGFASNVVVVVWVGRDDNQPLGLTGAEAALPIWTAFMKRAVQGALPAITAQGTR